jgi:hypothetical protein
MAEFLIKAINAVHIDPVKDKQGCYKRGDIVDVRPDGWPWGKEEGLPRFYIVKITGLSVDIAKKYMGTDNSIRRIWKVRADDVPTAIKNQLLSKGIVTVTWTQVKGYVRNKLTNLDET